MPLIAGSVASVLLLGGGGARPPNVPTEKNTYIRASERLRISVFSGLKIHLHIHIQSMQWYGTINYSMTDKTQHWEKSMNMRASGASELRQLLHLLILKLLFPSIFCLYSRYFVSQTYIFPGVCRQNTNIKKIYVGAICERVERASLENCCILTFKYCYFF